MRTAVDTIPTVSRTPPYTLTLTAIYCYKGCMSGTWWYAIYNPDGGLDRFFREQSLGQ